MPNPNSVADPKLPGDVLDPNAGFDNDGDIDPMASFGSPMSKPQVAAPANGPQDADPTDGMDDKELRRYQYWQAKYNEAATVARDASEKLKAVEPVLPLIQAMQRDSELIEMVRGRLSGREAAPKLEAPVRPDNYNEVEAYSTPDSASFKYRVANEKFIQSKMDFLERQLQQSQSETQRRIDMVRQQDAQRQQMESFKQQVVAMGIPAEQLPEFFNMIDNPKPEDLVNYYLYKTGTPNTPPVSRVTPAPGRMPSRQTRQPNENPFAFGDELIRLSRSMR